MAVKRSRAIRVAQNLLEPGELNVEYQRALVELLSDMFEDSRELVAMALGVDLKDLYERPLKSSNP